MPKAVARCVAAKAWAARGPAARAEPALKPNHPNHSRPPPMSVMGRLWGLVPVRPILRRGPTAWAQARAAAAEAMCTTAPPAKSTAPIWAIQPPPQTQWAMGQ